MPTGAWPRLRPPDLDEIVLELGPRLLDAWSNRFTGGTWSGPGVVPTSLVEAVVTAVAGTGQTSETFTGAAAALGVLRAHQGRQASTLVEDLLALRTTFWSQLATTEALAGALGDLLLLQQRLTEVVDAALRAAIDSFVDETQLELSRAATRDALTGLLNRAALLEGLAHELANRAGPPSVLLLDLDGFKQVNDTCGHLAGDDVLVGVAAVLQEACRAGDLLARLGGDEFAVVLPATTPDVARTVAARILARARRAKPLRPAGVAPVGLSVGLTWQPHPRYAEALLHAADEAMYAAKRSGGDSFQVAS